MTVLLLAGLLSACGSSIVRLSAEAAPIDGACNVDVYQTRAQATQRGEIEELCVISGSTSGSFRHTIANAIEMHKNKACDCGATDVFVESRSDTAIGVATVSLIAFRFTERAD